MKTLKHIIALLLVAAMAFSMAACSSVSSIVQDALDSSESDIEPSRGIVTGNTYKSEFIGIQCSLDESWTISDDEQLAQLAGMTASQIENENVKSLLENSSVVYDFYATKDYGFETLNINMNDLGSTGIQGDSEDQIAELARPQIESMLSDSGFEGCSVVKESIVFAGQEHPCYVITGSVSGVQVYEKMVMIIRSGVVIYVTACTLMEDTTDSLLSLFTAY